MLQKKIKIFLKPLIVWSFAMFLIGFSLSFAGEETKQEMPGMQHEHGTAQGASQGATEGATQGTETKHEMPGMSHEMGEHAKHKGHSWEDMKKWPGMEKKTKEELDAMMMMMPPDQEVYVSNKDLKKDAGVLLIAHGGSKVWNEKFVKSLETISKAFPTTVCFGMAMGNSSHIQEGINHLEEAGAKTIVVVVTFFTKYNEVTKQIEYIFGLRDKALWPPVEKVKSKAKLIFAKEMNDNPLLGEILTDHAKAISTNPKNEVVIIVGHGPVDAEDNKKNLAIMESLAKQVKSAVGFKEVKAWNLQDDAPKEIRNANVQKIRGMIEEANKKGNKALVVAMLISSRGIQHKIKTDFKGLNYEFNEEGIVTHENFGRMVGEAVIHAIVKE